MAAIYRRGSVWYLSWYTGGKHYYQSLRTTSKRVALYHRAKKDQQLASGRAHPLEGQRSVAQLLEEYHAFMKPRKTPRTHSVDGYRINKLAEQLSTVKLIALSPGLIETTLYAMQREQGFGSASQNRYLELLKAFGAWCVERGYAFENPAGTVRAVRIPTRPRTWLTSAQRATFLEVAETQAPHHFPMLATALLAGLRWGELVTLEWSDIDFANNLLHVRVKAGWSPKSKRGRTIPLHPRLREILESRRRPSGACFTTPKKSAGRGQPYKTKINTELMVRLFAAAGVSGPRIGVHTLRHSFATGLAQAGVSIWKVKEWLGHSDIRVTDIYAHLSPNYDADISRI